MTGLEFPAWLLTTFTVLVTFIVDFIKRLIPCPPNWVFPALSVATGEALCWVLRMDVFFSTGMVEQPSAGGIIITGLLMAAVASKGIYPAVQAVKDVGRGIGSLADMS